MKMSDFTPDQVGNCSCGEKGVYPRQSSKDSKKVYWKCRGCHAKHMKAVMRRRYATPEGRAAILSASRKWYLNNRKEAK